MFELISNLFLEPIIWLMSNIINQFHIITGSYGIAIIFMSIIISTLTIPLHNISNYWQKQDLHVQEKIAPKIAEFKRAFSGREYFMMIQTLYRQNNYHPSMALKNSFGLLIQIPFFFAAYQLLYNMPSLNGESFLIFANLNEPDKLLPINNLDINLFPFIMTAINLLNIYVSINFFNTKNHIQLYVLAGIFFILLFSAPVALLLYWTMNNLFSLGRNLIMLFNHKANSVYFINFKVWLIRSIHQACAILLIYFILSLLLILFIPDSGRLSKFLIQTIPFYIWLPSLYIIFISYSVFSNKENSFSKKREDMQFIDNSYILVPLIPFVQYLISNNQVLALGEIFTAIISFLFVFSIIFILIPYFLSSIFKKNIIQGSLLLISSVVLYMPILNQYLVGAMANLTALMLSMALITVIFYTIINHNNRRLLFFIFIVFISNSALVAINTSKNEPSLDVNSSETILENSVFTSPEFVKSNNVYLLAYDSYVPLETMKSYGIDNSLQEDFLVKEGFKLYPNIYSIGASSVDTMARLLDLKLFSENMLQNVSGDAYTYSKFKDNNYDVDGIFQNTYFFRGADSSYDYSYPFVDKNKKVNTLDYIYMSLAYGFFKFDIEYADYSYESFLNVKYDYLKKNSNKPRFLYTHTGPSHSLNYGQCRSDETQLFKKRLDIANLEMKKDIKTIYENDSNAIVIILGDHGPYLTKNCTSLDGYFNPEEIDRLDLQDRYGSFLAIKLPNQDFIDGEKILILQDLMPEILNYLTESEYFTKFKLPTKTVQSVTSGVYIEKGIIYGGLNDKEPLFIGKINEE